MKIAYLILAHKSPEQVTRLINKLSNENASFFVHIDKKANLEDFTSLFNEDSQNLRFIENREDGQWGDVGIVNATIRLMKEALIQKYDYYILLSGMDYPIKSNSEIQNFLNLNNGKSYIEYSKLPLIRLNYGGLDRVEGYSYSFRNTRYTYIPYRFKPEYNIKGHLLNIMLGVFSAVFKGKRKKPEGISDFYYGSQWWMLHVDAVEYIIKFINENPNYVDFHKYTLLSDELFFQTILLNRPSDIILDVINNNSRLICWDEYSSHPKMLQMEDIDAIIYSDALFARKFDENSKVLDYIDENYAL